PAPIATGTGTFFGAPGSRAHGPECRGPPCPAWRRGPWPSSAGAAGGVELAAEGLEPALLDRSAHVGHQLLVVPEVVQGAQHRPQHLVAAVQVAQVAAGIAAAAGHAAAAGLDRFHVPLVAGVADAHRAERGEVVAVAR